MPMFRFVPFSTFLPDLFSGLHYLKGTGGVGNTHVVHLVALRTAPDLLHDTVLANLTQIANGHGYTTDGVMLATEGSIVDDVFVLSAAESTPWTSDGNMENFSWVAVVNMTSGGLIAAAAVVPTALSSAGASQSYRFDGGVIMATAIGAP